MPINYLNQGEVHARTQIITSPVLVCWLQFHNERQRGHDMWPDIRKMGVDVSPAVGCGRPRGPNNRKPLTVPSKFQSVFPDIRFH
jgi:hypothetical protein